MASSRRSLYRQSVARVSSAGPFGNDIVDDKISHWTRDWVSPLSTSQSTASGSQNPSGTPGPSNGSSSNAQENAVAAPGDANGNLSAESGKPTFGFSVKMWVQVKDDQVYQPIVDCDDDDKLDLSSSSSKTETTLAPTAVAGDLTVDDIRGAVTGEAIPGIASYSGTTDTAQGESKSETQESTGPVVSGHPEESNGSDVVEVKGAEPIVQVSPSASTAVEDSNAEASEAGTALTAEAPTTVDTELSAVAPETAEPAAESVGEHAEPAEPTEPPIASNEALPEPLTEAVNAEPSTEPLDISMDEAGTVPGEDVSQEVPAQINEPLEPIQAAVVSQADADVTMEDA